MHATKAPWSLPCSAQAFVKDPHHRIASAGYQGSHVKCGAYGGPTAPDNSTAFECAAVAIERGDTDQGRDLLSIECSEFGQLSQQCAANDRADTGNAFKQILIGLPDRALADALIQVMIGSLELFFEPVDVSVDPFLTGLAAPLSRLVSATIISVICRRLATRARNSNVTSSGIGRTDGRTASAKRLRIMASIRSVLANCPVALAKSLTWRGLTATTVSSALARARMT